jgi:Zn finger protein HypA/HybF involved in hydrogenase expression
VKGRFIYKYAIMRTYLNQGKSMLSCEKVPIPKSMMCECKRCGHSWVKRVATRPARCPKCKQPKWDIPAGELKMGRPVKGRGKKD